MVSKVTVLSTLLISLIILVLIILSLRMRSREGGINVADRHAERLVSASNARPEQGREASHRVALIIGGAQKAGQLASDHASMAQAKLCSYDHRSVGPHGSPCHRSTPTCLVSAKLKSASQAHQQRVLEVATCDGLQAAPTRGARSRSPRGRARAAAVQKLGKNPE
jgi:hypothetical protein